VVFKEYNASPGIADLAATLVAPILPTRTNAISIIKIKAFIRFDLV